MKFELLIQNGGRIFSPAVLDGATWTTERQGAAGKLTFSVVKDGALDFQEGNPVSLAVDGKNVFYGFVFGKKRGREHHIEVTAFDQLRYLLNKDTYVYANKTASEVILMIAADFGLRPGLIEPTAFKIASRVEDNKTLLDMIQNALGLELANTRTMYVLYDDFGKLTLKSLANMKTGLVIDEETGENFDYASSIDDQTYNKIKLSYENEETGKRDVYVAQSGESINKWGVLQYHGTIEKGENGKAKAEALLDLYNAKTRRLKITGAFGDSRVRAGSVVIVKLALGDVNVSNYMLVEKCSHVFGEGESRMDLALRGGEFVGG
jgi:hypothetical protein